MLKRSELAAEGWLRDPQPACRARNAAFIGHHHEGVKIPQLHDSVMPNWHGCANLKALLRFFRWGKLRNTTFTMKTFSHALPQLGTATLRMALGVVMIAHAAAKYFVFTLAGTAAFFVQHGFPRWTAFPVFVLEAVGGLFLVLGWHTRWISAGLLPVMIGASLVHAPNGWMFTAPNGGWEYPAFLIFALAAQALLGNGAWALSNSSHVGSTGRVDMNALRLGAAQK